MISCTASEAAATKGAPQWCPPDFPALQPTLPAEALHPCLASCSFSFASSSCPYTSVRRSAMLGCREGGGGKRALVLAAAAAKVGGSGGGSCAAGSGALNEVLHSLATHRSSQNRCSSLKQVVLAAAATKALVLAPSVGRKLQHPLS